jgi:hypothetical protein
MKKQALFILALGVFSLTFGLPRDIRITPTGTPEDMRRMIQDSLNKVAGLGTGSVTIASGYYVIGQNGSNPFCLTIPQNVTLAGDATHLPGQAGTYGTILGVEPPPPLPVPPPVPLPVCYLINMESNSKLQNISFENRNASFLRSSGQSAIQSTGVYSVIHNVAIQAFDIGIALQGYMLKVDESEVLDCNTGIDCVFPGDWSNANWIQHCTILDSRNFGIRVSGSGNNISANHIGSTTLAIASVAIGIDVFPLGANTNSIIGNEMEGLSTHIRIGSNGNAIVGNYFGQYAPTCIIVGYATGFNANGSGTTIIGNSSMQNFAPTGSVTTPIYTVTQHNSFNSKVTVNDALVAGKTTVSSLTSIGDITTGSSVWVGGKKVLGTQGLAIPPMTGTTGYHIDGQARGTINQILAALRAHGLIAPK